MLRRFAFSAAAALAASAFAGAPLPARADHCSGALLAAVAERLRTIEAETPSTREEYVARSKELGALLGDPDAPLWTKTQDACPGDSPSELTTVVHRRVLVLWGKMIALSAIDGPIFRSPYPRECGRFDGSSLQIDFIRAWMERLDDAGVGFSRSTLWHALEDDPLYPHVLDLAQQRAARFKVTSLPALDSDEDAWLAANQSARVRFARALPTGAACGVMFGLWGLEFGGAVNAPRKGTN